LLAKALYLDGSRDCLAELERALALGKATGADRFAIVEGQHAQALLALGAAAGVTECQTTLARVKELRAWWAEQSRQAGDETAGGGLVVTALGGGCVAREGYPGLAAGGRALLLKDLFFYLLLHGPVERDAAGAVFWPDLPAGAVKNNFHNAIFRLREAVGPDVVVEEGGRYRLGDLVIRYDVEEFESLVERARVLPPGDWQAEALWRKAVALYGGDFLPNLDRAWCVPLRESLRERYVDALTGLGTCNEARGDPLEAVEWYRRALAVDELREDVHRRVMVCYAAAGRRPEALRHYHRWCETVRRELHAEPSLETKELYTKIIEG
jgi:DNA-binding SARP family transcriptional activator